MPYVKSKCPDELAHQYNLKWTFSVCRHILQYPLIMYADNEGLIGKLIRAGVVCKLYIRALFVCCHHME